MRNTSVDRCWKLLDNIRWVVGLNINVLREVVRVSVIRSICEVEGDVRQFTIFKLVSIVILSPWFLKCLVMFS